MQTYLSLPLSLSFSFSLALPFSLEPMKNKQLLPRQSQNNNFLPPDFRVLCHPTSWPLISLEKSDAGRERERGERQRQRETSSADPRAFDMSAYHCGRFFPSHLPRSVVENTAARAVYQSANKAHARAGKRSLAPGAKFFSTLRRLPRARARLVEYLPLIVRLQETSARLING